MAASSCGRSPMTLRVVGAAWEDGLSDTRRGRGVGTMSEWIRARRLEANRKQGNDMSDIREAFEAHYFSYHGGDNMTFDHANSYYLNRDVNGYWLAFQAGQQAALSANGGEVVGWLVSRKGDGTFPRFYFDKGLAEDMVKEVELPPSATMSPVYTHTAPPSVAVPEGWIPFPTEAWLFLTGEGPLAGRHFGDIVCDDKTGRDEPFWWRSHIRHMLTAAPTPDHSGDAGNVAVQRSVIEHLRDISVMVANGKCGPDVDRHIHDAIAMLTSATPSVPENDNGVSSAYDSGYLDAMLYARVCCDRLDNPENTKDYRDCARFLDLIFKSEIDEAARIRTAGDEGEE